MAGEVVPNKLACAIHADARYSTDTSIACWVYQHFGSRILLQMICASAPDAATSADRPDPAQWWGA